MPQTPPIVVKLGGSVITRKQRSERLRPKVLTRLAEELASSPGPLVVLHGAGSFGHPGAVRFRLALPPDDRLTPAQRARGAAIVSTEVRRLHLAVLQALVAAGARPWSLPPAGLASNRAGALVRMDRAPFEAALAAEMAPVSFGDVVPDVDWNHSILSADTIAVELARHLCPSRVLFVSDVPGVLKPASSGRPSIYPTLTDEALARLGVRAGGADVTGGIRGKALAMQAIARLGVDAGLISGLSDGALARALRGEAVHGTWCPAERR